jgi:hypothetical protein
MAGETDLPTLLRTLRPKERPGEYVYVTRPTPEVVEAQAMVVEDEGITYVVSRADADVRGWPYDFVAGWITLQVHSSLAAVGLTAAVSAALTAEGISANVLAAHHHDHVLVPHDRIADALAALARLAEVASP